MNSASIDIVTYNIHLLYKQIVHFYHPIVGSRSLLTSSRIKGVNYSTGHRQCQNETCLLPLQTHYFSRANKGVVFSHLTRCLGNKKKVAVSALFCILKAFPLMIFMLGDIRQ